MMTAERNISECYPEIAELRRGFQESPERLNKPSEELRLLYKKSLEKMDKILAIVDLMRKDREERERRRKAWERETSPNSEKCSTPDISSHSTNTISVSSSFPLVIFRFDAIPLQLLRKIFHLMPRHRYELYFVNVSVLACAKFPERTR